MKVILAAVDESKIACNVMREAAAVAAKSGASVAVCHVMNNEEAAKMFDSHARQTEKHSFAWTQPEERAKAVADEAARNLTGKRVHCDGYGLVGEPAPKILELAETLKADMIVMGFHGLHGLNKIYALGSVSRKVMEEAAIPVLIVPGER